MDAAHQHNLNIYHLFTDVQLIEMANENLPLLSEDSVEAYYQEVFSRQIELSTVLTLKEKAELHNNIETLNKDHAQFLFQSLEKNMPISTITEQFRNRGIDAWSINALLRQSPDFIEKKLTDCKEKSLNGALMFSACLALKLLPLSTTKHLALIILIYTIACYGALKWLDAQFRIRRYQKMLRHLASTLHQSQGFSFPTGENDAVGGN
jgi:hypothetical protein